jgi:hypothetical protein
MADDREYRISLGVDAGRNREPLNIPTHVIKKVDNGELTVDDLDREQAEAYQILDRGDDKVISASASNWDDRSAREEASDMLVAIARNNDWVNGESEDEIVDMDTYPSGDPYLIVSSGGESQMSSDEHKEALSSKGIL